MNPFEPEQEITYNNKKWKFLQASSSQGTGNLSTSLEPLRIGNLCILYCPGSQEYQICNKLKKIKLDVCFPENSHLNQTIAIFEYELIKEAE